MKYKKFLWLIAVEMLIFVLFYTGSIICIEQRDSEINAKKELVRELMLTDLSIWTEARYTRHPSQADYFTPFQDFPSSLEHFPAGSIFAPPATVKGETRIEFKK
jgi:hypothetical protein